MSAREEVERLAKDVENNDALHQKLKAFGTDQDAVIRYANEQGYDFTMDDMNAIASKGELSEVQLEGVAGGVILTVENVDGVKTGLSGTAAGYVFATTSSDGKTFKFLVW